MCLCVSVHVCVCGCVFFLFIYLCSCSCVCVAKKNKKLKSACLGALLSAAGPCMHTLGPKNSKRSIASRQASLKSTAYAFVGPPLKDLLYLLYSTPPIDSDESPPRQKEPCVCSHSRSVKQQTLLMPPWASFCDPAVSPNYRTSPARHTSLSRMI